MDKNFFGPEQAYARWEKRQQKNREKQSDGTRKRKYLDGMTGRIQTHLSGFLRVLVTAFIVFFQIGLILCLPMLFRENTVQFYYLLEICAVIAIVALVNRNTSPSYRLAWISIVLILPISGFVMYFLWGRVRGRRKRLNQHILHQFRYGQKFLKQDPAVLDGFLAENPDTIRMVRNLSTDGFALTQANQVEYYAMGEDAFEAIFEEVAKAERFILMDFFIVAQGALWDKMHEILKRKIKEGVEVYFMYDDFGAAIRTPKYFKQQLEHEGFQVRVFNPIHKYTSSLYMNFRTHQKIVVVDGKVGFTGGFNLADEYANLVSRFGVWKDTGVKICGEGVWGLTVVFLQMWEACGVVKEHIDYLAFKADGVCDSGDTYCAVIADGPVFSPYNSIERLYNQMINNSDEFLYITTPYLIIEDYMKMSLVEAARRGVDVRIIAPAIPDKKQVKLLTIYNYGELLRGGVKIYEYTPGFIHAKQVLTEDAAIVGTVNMDYRSFYLHYENGAWLSGPQVQQRMKKDFEETFAISREITYEEWKRRPIRWKLIQPILNLFSTLM